MTLLFGASTSITFMDFPLKSSYKPMQINGKVMWNRKEILGGRETAGMGIAFEKMKKSDLNALKEFLDNIPTAGWFL